MDYTSPEIAGAIVRTHQEEIRQDVHREHLVHQLTESQQPTIGQPAVPWRLSVARLLYRAGDALAGERTCRGINVC